MKQIKINKIQNKLRNKFVKLGVKMIAPETVFFSSDTKIGKNVVINPYVVIGPKVKIGNNVSIFSFSDIENAKIGNKVSIGPFARIRPGTVLEKGSRVGNFVNIGAGTITCNYDGVKKSKTIIKAGSFIGSNSSLVAPITINEKSVIGAGSVITKNVSKKSLALTRAKQIEKKNYKRFK